MPGTRPSVFLPQELHQIILESTIEAFDTRYVEGHTQVTAWVFCQGQKPLSLTSPAASQK